ncbi:MAG: malto-oligosyltrehalose trehalohydrolase, partial [Mycobacteriales bacterium]
MTTFEVWAPTAERVRLEAGDECHELTARDAGWWHAEIAIAAGSDYAYLLDDDETALPDPRSRWQPHGVHGPSRVYDDAAYEWHDQAWNGRQLPGSVLYEMHVGTFTPEGT